MVTPCCADLASTADATALDEIGWIVFCCRTNRICGRVMLRLGDGSRDDSPQHSRRADLEMGYLARPELLRDVCGHRGGWGTRTVESRHAHRLPRKLAAAGQPARAQWMGRRLTGCLMRNCARCSRTRCAVVTAQHAAACLSSAGAEVTRKRSSTECHGRSALTLTSLARRASEWSGREFFKPVLAGPRDIGLVPSAVHERMRVS